MFMKALDADELIAQLLASEGFTSLEEVAYVPVEEIADIEGFGEEMANELQTRAREYLEKLAQQQDAERREAGVEDEVLEIEGVTLPMAVEFGRHEVKTVEDVAGLIPDDIRGYVEVKDGEKVREPGILDSFGLSADAASDLIMLARVKAGWIDASALEPDVEEDEGEDMASEVESVEA